MIIKLTGADFSANNIGKINIRELNQFTISAINASGNNAMTDSQKYGLDDFFFKIGAFGVQSAVFSKMKMLYLPLISQDIAGARTNYANRALDLAGEFYLENKGIRNSNNTSYSLTLDSPISQDNITVFSAVDFNMDNLIRTGLIKIGNTNPGKFAFEIGVPGTKDKYTSFNMRDTGQFLQINNEIATNNKSFCTCFDGDASFIVRSKDTNIYETQPSYSESNILSSTVYPFQSFTATANSTSVARRMLMVSTALTQDEALLFKEAYDTLQDLFL